MAEVDDDGKACWSALESPGSARAVVFGLGGVLGASGTPSVFSGTEAGAEVASAASDLGASGACSTGTLASSTDGLVDFSVVAIRAN